MLAMSFLPTNLTNLPQRLDTLEGQLGRLVELFEENNTTQKELLAIARGEMPPIGLVTPIGRVRAAGKR